MTKTFPGRTAIEREIEALINPKGLRFNDGKDRVTLPGGTLQHLLRMLDTDADRIADLERQIAELRQPTAQQGSLSSVEDARDAARYQQLLRMSTEESVELFQMNDVDAMEMQIDAALQAGKEKEHGN